MEINWTVSRTDWPQLGKRKKAKREDGSSRKTEALIYWAFSRKSDEIYYQINSIRFSWQHPGSQGTKLVKADSNSRWKSNQTL